MEHSASIPYSIHSDTETKSEGKQRVRLLFYYYYYYYYLLLNNGGWLYVSQISNYSTKGNSSSQAQRIAMTWARIKSRQQSVHKSCFMQRTALPNHLAGSLDV